MQLISKVVTALILWFGAQAVIAGDLTVGQRVAFNMLAGQVNQPILRLAQLWQDFQQVRIFLRKLGDVRNAVPGIGPYSATKAAVECLIRSMSKELARRGVRVNAVAPGPVDTDLFRGGKDAAALARSAAMSPFNRVGQPAEVAEVVRFLASGRASWVAGQVVQPNGGMV